MDEKLQRIVLQLLESLEDVGKQHPELYDTETREAMLDTVYRVFLKPRPDFEIPTGHNFFMMSKRGNDRVRRVLNKYLPKLNTRASQLGLEAPNERLQAFYAAVETDEGRAVDDFFGWVESIE